MNLTKLLTLIFVSICVTFTSCIGEKDIYIPVPEIPETYTAVNFTVGGEISTTETPLASRAATTKDLYGIAIAMLIPNANNTGTTQKPYAYGIFDDEGIKNLSLNLLEGYNYRVACTVVIDGQDSLKRDGGGYGRPFTLDRNGEEFGTITNKFLVADQPDGKVKFLYDIDNSKIGSVAQENISRPFIKRYHGVIPSLELGTNNNNVLEVYRRYYAVNFKANGLKKDLDLKIKLDDSPVIPLDNTTQESGIIYITHRNLTATIEVGKIFAENALVNAAVYEKNALKTTILDYNMSFKRNYMHTIIISDIDNFGTDAGISINMDDEEMEFDAIKDIPWQGGK